MDFVGGMLHVRRNFTDGREKVPKGKRVRSVPMTPEVIDARPAQGTRRFTELHEAFEGGTPSTARAKIA